MSELVRMSLMVRFSEADAATVRRMAAEDRVNVGDIVAGCVSVILADDLHEHRVNRLERALRIALQHLGPTHPAALALREALPSDADEPEAVPAGTLRQTSWLRSIRFSMADRVRFELVRSAIGNKAMSTSEVISLALCHLASLPLGPLEVQRECCSLSSELDGCGDEVSLVRLDQQYRHTDAVVTSRAQAQLPASVTCRLALRSLAAEDVPYIRDFAALPF